VNGLKLLHQLVHLDSLLVKTYVIRKRQQELAQLDKLTWEVLAKIKRIL
jgi:hypothetical protein